MFSCLRIIVWLFLPLLLACSGGGSSSSGPCEKEAEGGVNWEALRTTDCPRLSDYGLFEAPGVPRSPGLVFEPSVVLFSDYTLKDRVVFIPPGEQAVFDPDAPFSFPVGSVLVKTFSLPTTTAGMLPARALETRLLIRRESGWVGLPYVWRDDAGDADLRVVGAALPQQILRDAIQVDFVYHVPDRNQCALCHQRDGSGSGLVPIGTRARYLHHEIEFDGVVTNQLKLWADKQMLTNVPADLDGFLKVPAPDSVGVSLAEQARGYLDINCAHCHRDGGTGGRPGLRLGFEQNPDSWAYGVCKKPPGYGVEGFAYDIVPGAADKSILLHRMKQVSPKDAMPPFGRKLVHEEGVALIEAWINSLPPRNCDKPNG